jgi:hypothetical protein
LSKVDEAAPERSSISPASTWPRPCASGSAHALAPESRLSARPDLPDSHAYRAAAIIRLATAAGSTLS